MHFPYGFFADDYLTWLMAFDHSGRCGAEPLWAQYGPDHQPHGTDRRDACRPDCNEPADLFHARSHQ
jgi:hypothetical protein